MPLFKTFNDDDKPVTRYLWPAQYVTPLVEIADALRQWRKTAVRDREEFLSCQKVCGSDYREGARFFKACANRMLKIQRSCSLMLPWFGAPDSNQRPERPLLWPTDLAEELDEVSNRILLQYG